MFFNASTNHALGSTANIVRNERKLCKRVDKNLFLHATGAAKLD